MATASLERWPPLETPSSTRLIKLKPASQSTGPAIECELASLDLENTNAIPYEALSYVWGKLSATEAIHVNGHLTHVTPNLHQALASLRRPDGARLIWIDQLCINQSDVVEKNKQVGLMGRIYASASRVVVWLGMPDWSTGAVLETVQKLADISTITPVELHRLSAVQASEGAVGDLSTWDGCSAGLFNGLLAGEEWASQLVKDFLENEWFRRTWTFQEVVLARECELVCGTARIAWDTLSTACDTIGKAPLIRQALREAQLPVLIASWRRHLKQAGTEPMGLLDLVGAVQDRLSTDPKDKVFALLGLPQPRVTGFEIDYRLSTAQVYCSLVRWSIANDRNLDVFSYAQRSRDPAIPSWCRDWRDRTVVSLMFGIRDYTGEALYTASGDSLPDMSTTSDHTRLVLKGCVVGRVIRILDLAPLLSNKRDYRTSDGLASWFNAYETVIQTNGLMGTCSTDIRETDMYHIALAQDHLSTPHTESDRLSVTIQRTLCAGLYPFSHGLNTQEEDSGLLRNFPAFVDWRRSGPADQVPDAARREFDNWVAEMMVGRAMALVRDESGCARLAIMAEDVRVGDEICLFAGGRVLYATRPKQSPSADGSERMLLSECYVDRLMNGECMLWVAERGLELVDLVLV